VPLKSLKVGEQRSLQRLAPLPRPRCVRLQPEGLQPLALDQRFVEREQLQLPGGWCFVGNRRGSVALTSFVSPGAKETS
jgi:hypothetical protein